MRRQLFLFTLFVISCISTYGQIPVILRLEASEQEDTTGCNFVRELTRITYDAIMAGKVKLWNSPAKEILIMPLSLKQIERSTRTNFTEQEVIFIYEYWSNTNKVLSSQTNGFLFSNKTLSGADVEYGFVEYQELQPVFMTERVNSNANGNYNSNLDSYILSKNYNFNFLQFAGKVINNKEDSRKIFEEFIGSSRFNLSQFSSLEIPQKKVTWTVDFSTETGKIKALNGNNMLLSVEKYLRQNEEVFYNMGGEKILNHVQKGKWKVTRLQLTELWKKVYNTLSTDPIGLTVYINDSTLSEVPYKELVKWDVKVGDLALVDFIRLQNYNFVIRKINSQDIPRSESYAYYKALQEADWKNLTGFIQKY